MYLIEQADLEAASNTQAEAGGLRDLQAGSGRYMALQQLLIKFCQLVPSSVCLTGLCKSSNGTQGYLVAVQHSILCLQQVRALVGVLPAACPIHA